MRKGNMKGAIYMMLDQYCESYKESKSLVMEKLKNEGYDTVKEKMIIINKVSPESKSRMLCVKYVLTDYFHLYTYYHIFKDGRVKLTAIDSSELITFNHLKKEAWNYVCHD